MFCIWSSNFCTRVSKICMRTPVSSYKCYRQGLFTILIREPGRGFRWGFPLACTGKAIHHHWYDPIRASRRSSEPETLPSQSFLLSIIRVREVRVGSETVSQIPLHGGAIPSPSPPLASLLAILNKKLCSFEPNEWFKHQPWDRSTHATHTHSNPAHAHITSASVRQQ